MRKSNRPQRQTLIHLVLVSLTLSGLLSPASAYSDPTSIMETSTISNTPVNDYKTSNTNQSTPLTQSKPDRKNVLIDDSRGLSAFFMFGIAINIVMAVTFSWWFLREWRRSKK